MIRDATPVRSRRRRNEAGVAALEFALVLPVRLREELRQRGVAEVLIERYLRNQ